MKFIRGIDQQEAKMTSGADFGTSELTCLTIIINGFPFPFTVEYFYQQEDFDDDREYKRKEIYKPLALNYAPSDYESIKDMYKTNVTE